MTSLVTWAVVCAAFAQDPPPPPEAAPVAASGTIRGRVLERGSGIPLAAQVTAGDQTVTADADGWFSLDLPAGTHQVLLSTDDHPALAFDEAIEAGVALDVLYRLDRGSWDAEVVVYGEQRREEVSRRVLTAEELRLVPGSFGDPIRALQSLPSVARPATLEGDIVVRGAEALNTGTYIDEIPVPYLFHFFVGRSVVNPAVLDDVEFFAGGMPSRFGDVTQAVVNARTLDTEPERGLHGRISVDPLDFAASAETRINDQWTLQGAYRVSWVGALMGVGARAWATGSRLTGETPEWPGISYSDHLARATWEDGPDRVVFTWLGAHDALIVHPERYDTDGDGDIEPEPLPSGLPYDPRRLMDSGFQRGHVRWDRKVGGREQTTWIAAGNDLESSAIPGIGQFADGVEMGRLTGWSVLGRREDRFPIGDDDAIRAGIDANHGRVQVEDYVHLTEAGKTTITTDLRTSAGAWAEIQANAGGWTVAPGFRAGSHAFNGEWYRFEPEPRLTVRRTLGDRWSATGFVGRFSQVPPADRYADGIGNPDVGLMKAWQASTGVEARYPSGVELDLTVYGSRTEDLVVKDFAVELRDAPPDGFHPRDQEYALAYVVPVYRETTGLAYGVEAMVRARPSGGWFGWAALNVGRSLRLDGDGTVHPGDYDAPFSLTLVGARRLPKDWRVSGKLRLTSGYPFTPMHGVWNPSWGAWSPMPGEPNSDRFPMFRQLDLRVDRTWTARRARWTAYLDVLNALNSRNLFYASYEANYSELEPTVWIPTLPVFGLEVAY